MARRHTWLRMQVATGGCEVGVATQFPRTAVEVALVAVGEAVGGVQIGSHRSSTKGRGPGSRPRPPSSDSEAFAVLLTVPTR